MLDDIDSSPFAVLSKFMGLFLIILLQEQVL